MTPWADWRPASCMPDHCFCEAVGDGLVRQPANTWSSLGFVIVAILLLLPAKRVQIPRFARDDSVRTRDDIGLAATLTLIGLGSAFYHASMTFAGQFADVMGMYMLATFVLMRSLAQQASLQPRTVVGCYLALNMALGALLYATPALRRYLFALVVLAALLLEGVSRRKAVRAGRRYLLGAVGTLIVAFAIWTIDLRRIACVPESLIQGHAVWHLLGAASAWLLAMHYRALRSG